MTRPTGQLTGATLEPTWCPSCARHALDADRSCTACGAAAFIDDED